MPLNARRNEALAAREPAQVRRAWVVIRHCLLVSLHRMLTQPRSQDADAVEAPHARADAELEARKSTSKSKKPKKNKEEEEPAPARGGRATLRLGGRDIEDLGAREAAQVRIA